MVDDSLNNLKYDEKGLIPAIVQDAATGQVLTLAFMNSASLARTIETGETWFWSRSRQELWHKGATSGNTQRVTGIRLDCDGDALLISVAPRGPACHTGQQTCFHHPVTGGMEPDSDSPELGTILADLYRVIVERERTRPEKSYTTYLFNHGIDKILKKVGEESAETIIAAKNVAAGNVAEKGIAEKSADRDEGRQLLASEISDLIYHLLVMMVDCRVGIGQVTAELATRTGRPALAKYDSAK
jgi:phosphoribosyl-ATP pyrophosphohydrolase/phosphoribosyl-AMP cyclohydrolase